MITGNIVRQRLNLCDSHVVADTIDYLEAKFIFKTDDWDGLEKWAHFAKDSAVYDIRLTEDCIRKEDHLNLFAGMWKIYLHGNEFRDGEVIQRITTDEAVLYVSPTGTLDGEPFPEMPASVTEQILARLDNLEENGGGGGSGGLNPVDKTDAMTQPVGRDENGRLWTRPGGEGGGGGATAFVEVPVSTGSADEYVFDDGWTADAVVAEIDAGRIVILVDGSTPYYYGGYFSKLSETLQFINNSSVSHRRLYLRGDTLSYSEVPYSKSVTEYIQCYTSDGVWKSALTFDEIQELVDNEIRCVVFIEYSDGSRREYHYAGIAEGTMHVFVYAYANIIYMVKIHQDGTVESSLSNLVPRTRTINGKPLSANITLNASDVGAVATVNGAEPDENGDVTVRELPKYAEADEGKVLSVVDGVLAWADAPSGGGGINVTYDENTGDLTITSSSGGVAFDETTGNLTIGG